MVKYAQAIRRLLSANCLSLFDHFVGLALKGLITIQPEKFKSLIGVADSDNCFFFDKCKGGSESIG